VQLVNDFIGVGKEDFVTFLQGYQANSIGKEVLPTPGLLIKTGFFFSATKRQAASSYTT
jgi:hypothetical protein